MIVELGHFALVLALALALVQCVVPLYGAARGQAPLMAVAPPVALVQFALVAMAFLALTYAHVVSDFSVRNVVENSHSAKPLIYKISGVWGSHEGSMMLWVLILTSFGAAVALCSRNMPADMRANVLGVQAWISAAFLAFILFTSNPFDRLNPAPLEGHDLNPILQDLGLAIHPPLLYLGYVGLSITFSFAAAALISGRIDAVWARFVRPWTLAAWIFLTLGIAMGSYWAYYTLGWGGFWFWDPVENASLMPWLAATALLHSAGVMEKREALKIWTVFLAILAFSLSLLGTFLVRSGVLTSVHSFANDPARGVFILAILVFFIGGSLALFAWRAGTLKPGGLFAPVSREGGLVLNNLLLTAACATVLVGTLYPLALEAVTGEKISVGPPFFNLTIAPFAVALVVVMPIGQLLAWKRGDLWGAVRRLSLAMVAFILTLLITTSQAGEAAKWTNFGLAFAVFLIIGSGIDVTSRIFARNPPMSLALTRAIAMPRAAWGAALAHAGFGLTLMGLAASGWGVERILLLQPGNSYHVGPYELALDGIAERDGENYHETYAHIALSQGGIRIGDLEPSRRFYATRNMSTTQAGIATLGFGQIYVSIADQKLDGAIDARLYWKPLVSFIWLGALLMAFGGLLSLSDRRLRIGFAKRARTSPVNAPQTQAAE